MDKNAVLTEKTPNVSQLKNIPGESADNKKVDVKIETGELT
jgi:hypothetical protein